jgi:putative transposase
LTNFAYRNLLQRHRFRASIPQGDFLRGVSRKGNCHDNAVAESFFLNLKNEMTHHTIYETRQEAKAAIFDYIELFYNRLRPHQTLDYRTPAEAEAAYIEMLN